MALAVPSFAFGNGFAAKTPQDVARNRAVYQALLTQGTQPKSLGTGLTSIGEAITARLANDRANEAETAGQAHAADLLKTLQTGNPSQADLLGAVSDPWVAANPGESAVAQTLLKRQMDASDPGNQLDLAYKQAQIDALKVKDSGFSTLTPDEATAAGLPPGATYQKGPDGHIYPIKGPTNGLEVTTNPDGTTTVSMGGTGKPLTEAQGKDVYFINQGGAALPTLDKMGDSLTSIGEGAALGGTPLIGNYLKSSDYQQAEQAGRQFLNAILRKESGAAISETEDKRYGDTYLPRPGDKPPVLAQKKAARANALLGIKLGLPAPAILALQQSGFDFGGLAKEASGTDPAAPPAPNAAQPATVPDPTAPVKINGDSDFDALPPGTPFIGPDGKKRVKPGAPPQKVVM